MEFSVKSGSPEKQRSACIVVGVFEPRRLSPIAEQLDKISDGYISALLRRGELEGKPGQTLLLHHVPNILSERILLIGCAAFTPWPGSAKGRHYSYPGAKIQALFWFTRVQSGSIP